MRTIIHISELPRDKGAVSNIARYFTTMPMGKDGNFVQKIADEGTELEIIEGLRELG